MSIGRDHSRYLWRERRHRLARVLVAGFGLWILLALIVASCQGAPPAVMVSGQADFNGDGFVTGDDFDGYSSAFVLGLSAADFNQDGWVTGDDHDQYVAAYREYGTMSGFTAWPEGPHARSVYVSQSAGNDANDGSTEALAVKTLARVRTIVHAEAQGVYAWRIKGKRGDVWTNETFGAWTRYGYSADEPMVFETYGTGARPRCRPHNVTAIEWNGGPTNFYDVVVTGWDFAPGQRLVSDQVTGIYWGRSGGRVRIEDCAVGGFKENVNLTPTKGVGDSQDDLVDVVFRRNIIENAYFDSSAAHAQGLFGSHWRQGVVEENVFYHNGWNESDPAAYDDIFNHNVYLTVYCVGTTIRNNISILASAHGLNCPPQTVVENNVIDECPIGVAVYKQGATVRGNTIFGSRDITVGGARSLGVNMFFGATYAGTHALIDGNVIAWCTSTGTQSAINDADSNATALVVDIRNNVVHRWGRGLVYLEDAVDRSHESWALTGNIANETASVGVVEIEATAAPVFVNARNTYTTPKAAPFTRNGSALTLPQWSVHAGEVGTVTTDPGLPDPSRVPETYATTFGYANKAALYSAMRTRAIGDWPVVLDPGVMNAWLKGGYIRASGSNNIAALTRQMGGR